MKKADMHRMSAFFFFAEAHKLYWQFSLAAAASIV
jgi:hypothetical protein